MKRNNLVALLILLGGTIHAQYGNEWIDYSQTYYKIKIVEDGFYRVTATDLEVFGFPTSSVSASRIQLFRRGEEVAIDVTSDDGILEYLEFYAEKNRGDLDTELYEDISHQANLEYNLFADTATYFLTWKLTSENGKRMDFSSLNDPTGLDAQTFSNREEVQVNTNQYSSGLKFGSGGEFSLSTYVDGEGWTGVNLPKGSSQDYTFDIDDWVGGNNGEVEVALVGWNTLNHNVDILAGPNTGSLRNVGNVQFSNRTSETGTFTITEDDVSSDGTLLVRVLVAGFDGASDQVSVSSVKVTYPEEVTMDSEQVKTFGFSDLNASERAYVQIATSNPSEVSVYNITDKTAPIRLATTVFTDRLDCILPESASTREIVAVRNPSSPIRILRATFDPIDEADIHVITHPGLQNPASDGLDPVQAYADYRASQAGGGYSTEITSIFQVFDQFSFGDPSPLAIHRMMDYVFDTGDPMAAFLIGKGRTPDLNIYRSSFDVINVPTYGWPGSDNSFTSGLSNDPFQVDLPIGRLIAHDPEDVKIHLDKIKEHEALGYSELFRKDILQLSGGQSNSELTAFRNYIGDFQHVLEGDFLGGRAINFAKEGSDVVEQIDVVQEVNQGVNLITFFGHSGGTVTDIEIGLVSNPQFGYANQGKYPVILINGCNAGNIFFTNVTLGEDWMINEPALGARNVIANSSNATSSGLKSWSDFFYEVSFAEEETFGSTIGEITQEVSNRYFEAFGTDDFSQIQVNQMVLQGDPMLRMFDAESPDYDISEDRVLAVPFQGTQLLATQDSLQMDLLVRNFGRTITDSLQVRFLRTLPGGEIQEKYETFLRPLREDTLRTIWYNENSEEVAGINTFEIFLDPLDDHVELDENNNYVNVEVRIFQGSTSNLYPINYGVFENAQVDFTWQPTNLLEEERGYELQVDTVNTFNSSMFQSFTTTGTRLMSHTVDFSSTDLPDSTTFYWRTRFSNPQNDDEEIWQQSSFTLIDDAQEGWGQFRLEQIEENGVEGVTLTPDAAPEFITSETSFEIATSGGQSSDPELRVLVDGKNFLATNTGECKRNRISAMVFDRESGAAYRPITISGADVSSDLICGNLPQVIYNFTESEVTGGNARLEQLINNMSNGDNILLFSIGSVNYSNWDSDVLAALEQVGISQTLVGVLTDGQPLIALGQKGDAPGTATTVITDGSAAPLTEQDIQMNDMFSSSFISGQITTQAIGPAGSWNEVSYRLDREASDETLISVIGVLPSGVENVLLTNSGATNVDISSIDASAYPTIKLDFTFIDATDLTPPELEFWQVNYQLPPEGMLLGDDQELLAVQEGEEVDRSFAFYNYSTIDFTDSLTVNSTLRSAETGSSSTTSFKIGPPLAGDSVNFELTMSTIGQGGLNDLTTVVVPSENEQYAFNNTLEFPDAYQVQADNTNPLIELTIDGRQIMNGDVVSPEPTIVIRMRDDNSFILKTDTLGMDVQLKRPCDGCEFERIDFSDPTISVVTATESSDFEITYIPGTLEDGVYTISVQARDQSGNPAGTEPYQIQFEVVSESSITHFYPYPNPFSTQTRFVFTVTGTEVPERLKIQIMTITGRIVREINQDEIGPIHIGNNISEFAWDGTDEYGDQLANGVYFYRVVLESNQYEHRATLADGAFKDGFGKLYILR